MDFIIHLFNLLGMLIWMLPPLRQYGTRFFLYFLMFGFADWAGILYIKYISQTTNYLVYILVSAAAFIVIQEKDQLKKHYLIYSAVLLISAAVFLGSPDILTGAFLMLILHGLITVTLIRIFFNYFLIDRMINIFLVIMIFYELTALTKIATLITGFSNNYLYFGTTTAIQIILGLFFSVFRYDYKRFYIQLK